MKELVEHAYFDKYVKNCLAYAVVYRVAEVKELILEKYYGNRLAFERLCGEMLDEGYIPGAYVVDFKQVTIVSGCGCSLSN